MRSVSVFAVGILAMPCLISAVPTTTLTTAALTSPPNAQLVNQSDFDTIAYYEQFAAASYCFSNIVGANGPVTCNVPGSNNVDNCPDVERNKVVTTFRFANDSDTDTTGFVAVDNVNGLVVVSFRGTQTFKNVRAIFNLGLTPLDVCKDQANCLGHAGFFESWKNVRTRVISAIRTAIAQNSNLKKVVVTGHSLGAAIASIAAVDLRSQNFNVDLAAYGSPRVGNIDFAREAVSPRPGKMGRNFRVVHIGDRVPQVPLKIMNLNGNYEHILPGLDLSDPPSPATIIENNMDLDVDLNDILGSLLLPGALEAIAVGHNFYFNQIAACGQTSVITLVQQHIPEIKAIFARLVTQFMDPTLALLNDAIQLIPNPATPVQVLLPALLL